MKAVMAISTKQALAVAKANEVALPKGSGSVKIGDKGIVLRRLSMPFRKKKTNAQAFRLSASKHEDLSQFHALVDANGRSVCIVWKNDDEA